MKVSPYYLSPLGQAVVKAHALALKAKLAQRRAEREAAAALVQPQGEAPAPIPVGEATESDFGAFDGAARGGRS